MHYGLDKKFVEMLNDLDSVANKLGSWEVDFVDNIRTCIENGTRLSDRQIDKVKEIHEKKYLGW